MSGTPEVILTKKDFTSDQTVRWCPGCGDYSVLKAVQSALPRVGKKKEDVVFISGIGCAARFPYYIESFGFHSIHGRAPAVALGTKSANPNLSVWVASGDGDAMAIGGNHFIHACRRNIDVNLLLFNNEIYGLTKGQYSPTSQLGIRTKSSPQGTIDSPFYPGELAVGAGVSFFARVPDKDSKYMEDLFVEAELHRGLSLIEILQNCPIFNDAIHDDVTLKENAANHQIRLVHGKPMLFGEKMDKGLRLNGFELEIVTLGENGVSLADILIHDAENQNPAIHQMLIRMRFPQFPVAMGIIRRVKRDTYDGLMTAQIESEVKKKKYASLDDMFNSGDTWIIN